MTKKRCGSYERPKPLQLWTTHLTCVLDNNCCCNRIQQQAVSDGSEEKLDELKEPFTEKEKLAPTQLQLHGLPRVIVT